MKIGDTIKIRDEYSDGLPYKTGVVIKLHQGMVTFSARTSDSDSKCTCSEKLMEVVK